MAFFNKLNNVARSAAKSAAELANDAIGTGKIAMKIKREEILIEQQYEKIGEFFYKKRNEGMVMPAELEELCVAIDISLATIKELEELREEYKDSPEIRVDDIPYTAEDCDVFRCPSCGKELTRGTIICSECGSHVTES